MDSVDSEAVALFTAELAAKKSGDKILSVLHQILKAAFEWGLSPKMPTFIGPPKRKPKKKLFPPDLFELLLVEAKANGPDVFALILLAGEMAMRSGELRGLCWEQIDWRTGRPTVDRQLFEGQLKQPKGEKSRTFKPTPRTLVALEQRRHFRSEFVFCDEDGRPWTKCHVERLCSRLDLEVGVRMRMGRSATRSAPADVPGRGPPECPPADHGARGLPDLAKVSPRRCGGTSSVGAKLAFTSTTRGGIPEKPAGAEVHILAGAPA